MDAIIPPKSLALPMDRRIKDKKILTRPMPSVEVRKRKLLLVLTIWTWIVAAFVSIAFYVAVCNNQMGTESLAGLLLGMIIFGWIMVARYFRATIKFVQSTEQGDQYGKQN